MKLHYSLASDRGRERENNEDTARAVPDLGLFIIADGMGGHVAGEIASQLATDTLITVVREHGSSRRVREDGHLLGEATLAANRAVLQEAESRELYGMGTTLTAVRIRKRTATIAHVGDTRASFLLNGELQPLTKDHTVVTLMVESGTIPAEMAKLHPERHLLTQAIGTQHGVEPDVSQLRIPRRARILMSTDGLHDVVPEAELIELASEQDLEIAAQNLVERANELGGPDNVSLILIDP